MIVEDRSASAPRAVLIRIEPRFIRANLFAVTQMAGIRRERAMRGHNVRIAKEPFKIHILELQSKATIGTSEGFG
jgi:hypothetical protein